MAFGASEVFEDLVQIGIKSFHAEVVDHSGREVGAVLVYHVISLIIFIEKVINNHSDS